MSLLKRCSKCKEIKPVDSFYKSKKDGLQAWCKVCCNGRKRNKAAETQRRMMQDDQENRLKECGICNIIKSYTEFSRNKRGRLGLDDWCKLCRVKQRGQLPKNYQRDYYSKNPGRGREQREKWRTKNCSDWYKYLRNRYNNHPQCECCGKKLSFGLGRARKSEVVCFDHRHEGVEKICGGPHSWIMNHTYNDKNVKIFESCDFGVLCHGCNKLLPTVGRRRWLEQAVNYVEKTKASYLDR